MIEKKKIIEKEIMRWIEIGNEMNWDNDDRDELR